MNTITRRTALAGAGALPLLPATALAVPAPISASTNATDAAWATLQAAQAHYDAQPGDTDDQTLDRIYGRVADAERDILLAKAATLTDVERKLVIISKWDGWNFIQPEAIGSLLADVRSLMGVAS